MPGNVHGGESIRNAQWQLAEHLKKCVMAVPADVGKPTRKVAGVRVME